MILTSQKTAERFDKSTLAYTRNSCYTNSNGISSPGQDFFQYSFCQQVIFLKITFNQGYCFAENNPVTC